MKKKIASLLVLFAICLSLVPAARAQEMPSAEDVVKTIFVIIFGEDFPDEWLSYQGFAQFIVFPFVALFAIFYGLMSEIRIFRTPGGRTAQKVIALMMALVAGKAILWTMRGILITNAWLGMFGFGAVLFIGILFWAIGGIIGGARRGIYEISGREISRGFGRKRRITEIRNELRRIDIAAARPGVSAKQIAYLERRARELTDELDRLLGEEEHPPERAGP